jgi:ribosomal protein S18 acetylase RimI-like enzyme
MQVAQASVRRAEPADYPRLARTFAAAFAGDPAWSWLLPYPDREQRLRLFFETELEHLVPERRQIWTTDDCSAVAAWGPPGLWSVPVPTVLRFAPRMLRVFGRRLPFGLRYLMRVERKHPRTQHWYLEILGTAPERQGQGLGSALLRPILALCDRDGVGAYLESSSDRSQALYERHGFGVVEVFDMPGGGPPIRRMWRDSQRRA